MKSLFVVMRGGSSPIAIVIPTPVAVFSSRKSANKWILSKQYAHQYYVRKSENLTESDA
jgi:hypothetical protein